MTCSRVRVRSRGLSDVLASRAASRHARRRPTMRDDRRGGGAGTAPAAARTAPGTRPADPARARLPQRTRRRPERAITAGPRAARAHPHHTRETHSDALATTPRTRRTRPSRPPPQPPRPTSSKPPLNNLHDTRNRRKMHILWITRHDREQSANRAEVRPRCRGASGRLLRRFPSATLLHPPLYEERERSRGEVA